MKTPPPDLQELVVIAGGYAKIAPEMWTAFDRAMDAYQEARREVKFDDKADLALAILAGARGPEQAWPYKRCGVCGREARFGYHVNGELKWFCAAHRLAKCWADARR
jgi:hypothetical protein